MSRSSRLLAAAAAGGLLVAARGHVARFLRTLDQRSGLFAPHGAAVYDAVAPFLLRPLYRRAADEAAAAAVAGGTGAIAGVLEIGSGPGELSIEIARRLPGSDVVGIDLAETMIRAAADRARAAGLDERVRFVLADAARLPLDDDSIDITVSTLSLHHWSDPGAVFAEIGRVLRPGGTALIYDLRPFAYTRHELEVFVAGTPLEAVPLERALVALGQLPAFFVRIRLAKPIRT
ncbi:MAG: class I SAM-dependent methyltransferase [Chloroflexi bacterium]|nr:class I SAM-dependent methyltransferase [Chloroflexota bacterium]